MSRSHCRPFHKSSCSRQICLAPSCFKLPSTTYGVRHLYGCLLVLVMRLLQLVVAASARGLKPRSTSALDVGINASRHRGGCADSTHRGLASKASNPGIGGLVFCTILVIVRSKRRKKGTEEGGWRGGTRRNRECLWRTDSRVWFNVPIR